jgi:hypothetical protein
MVGPRYSTGLAATALSLLVSIAHSQSSVTSLEPAATVVPETTAAGAPLLKAETIQLTKAVVKRLEKDEPTADIANLFAFGETAKKRASPQCKTYPGDKLWPEDRTWDIFNLLLADSLIPTVPISAPCYDSQWGPKNHARCNEIVNTFTQAPTQYVFPFSSQDVRSVY